MGTRNQPPPEQEREKPLHKGVIFVDISKDGYCRLTGYTGSKDDGDQNLVLNLQGKDPGMISKAGAGLVETIVGEMFRVHGNQAAK